jgi:adenylate cyclase
MMIPGPPPGRYAEDGAAASDQPTLNAPDLPPTDPPGGETAARALTYADFAAALRDALRDFHSADLLARNPLLVDGICNLGGSAGPLELKAMLTETVSTLFGNPRDEKLRRVIELTYFQPAPKQEVVADRLSLSFGTYRRHLTTGRDRLARWLWESSRVAPIQSELPSAGWPTAKGEKPEGATAPSPEAGEPAPPRLSVVILPFTNLSNDPEQEYFADGITEDLTTDLSRITGSFVIARSTAFTYKGKPVDTRQIGRELGVRYVIEGSVRRSDREVRVNVQLIDAETGAHLWAERLDRDLGDLFSIQNEITGRIARALQFELAIADTRRLTEHPDALDYILRGRALAWWKPISRENNAEGVSLFKRALALDPRAIEAQIGLASMLVSRVFDFWSDAPDVDLQHADQLIARALAVSPNSAWAHYAKGQVLRAQSQYEDAAIEYETAITLDRNLANAYAWLGRCKLAIGSVDEVIPLVEYAIRLSPHDRNLAAWCWQIGAVHLLKARADEAVRWLEKARSAYAGYHYIHASLAAGYALRGETKRASVALGEARRLSNRYSSIAGLKAAPGRQLLEAPRLRALAEATYFAGLRKAGLPEE